MDQAVKLFRRPGWSDTAFWEVEKRATVIPLLEELSRFDLETLRSAMRRIAAPYRTGQGWDIRASANAYALNRFLFNAPTMRRLGNDPKRTLVPALGPLRVGADGKLELSFWGGSSLNGGIDPGLLEPDLEFDRFRAQYGLRLRPGWVDPTPPMSSPGRAT